MPFVALDNDADLVAEGQKQDRPVYFGDAASAQLLERVSLAKAKCVVVVLSSMDANIRCVRAVR